MYSTFPIVEILAALGCIFVVSMAALIRVCALDSRDAREAKRQGGLMGMIPPEKETEVHRGSWEGQSVCAACKCGLSGGTYAHGEYYSNNSVCPHCGASEGLEVIVRRPVFNRPVRKQTWWEKLRGIPVKELPFKWEVKKTDG